MLTMEGPFQDTTPILGSVCARHHTNLRVISEQICMTLNALDAAICDRDGERWTAAQRVLGHLIMQFTAAMDRVENTIDMAGEA